MWTQFWDMHSGGGLKEKYSMIYIEAPQKEAEIIFYNRFGHNPNRVSCTCCGGDYSITENESLEQLTAYHRNCEFVYLKNGKEISQKEAFVLGKGCKKGVVAKYIERQEARKMDIRKDCNTKDDDKWGLYQTLKEYCKNKDVLIIRKKDIKENERIG